jgi:hypothetical protein
MTRGQSNNQCIVGIAAHPAPKIQSAKICWKSSRLDFSGSRLHPPRQLSSKGSHYQRGVLLIFAGVTEGHFEGKTQRRGKGVMFLHANAPAQRAPTSQKKLAYLDFQYLHHPPCSLDLATFGYYLLPGLKKQLKGSHFSSDTDFFEWLTNIRATG